MSADRELLELAAKAAGIERAICYDSHPEDGFPTAYAKTGKRTYWNPLTDDGDAFRLGVKLNQLRAYVYEHEVSLAPSEFAIIEPCNGDPCAATRRAIVRAAAAVGKDMP